MVSIEVYSADEAEVAQNYSAGIIAAWLHKSDVPSYILLQPSSDDVLILMQFPKFCSKAD